MLSIEVCRKFCRAANLNPNDEEVAHLKDFLYQLAQLSWQSYQEEKMKEIKKQKERKN